MPQVDLSYSADIALDAPALLAAIEAEILRLDPTAGDSKGRAQRVKEYHHSHVFLTVQLLPKPHRDDAYSQRLLRALDTLVALHLTQSCALSIRLAYSLSPYVTREFVPEAEG